MKIVFSVTEGNIQNKLLYLPNSAKTTELFHLFGIETAKCNTVKVKLNLKRRFRENEYTNKILNELNKLNIYPYKGLLL